jgi:pyruvate/2-oxoglutarate dehydrogenase complex dihydrolipoamide dehydrogenase (E3) component
MAYEFNLVIIGGGAAGLVSAIVGSALKAKVALIEKHEMGGDCLNTGCVPSKAIIKSAKVVHQISNAHKYGIKKAECEFDFEDIMKRVHETIAKIAPNDSIERFTSLGVDCFTGDAEIIDKHTVKVGDRVLTTKNIILAHGAEPFIPPIKGLDQVKYLTSENLWQLKILPKKLIVLGGGPIGTEMTQSFQRLGSSVTQIEMMNRTLVREDDDIANVVINTLKEEGVTILTDTKAEEIEMQGDTKFLVCRKSNNETIKVEFDEILIAVGRKARSIGPNAEKLGIKLRPNGTIDVDDYMRANGSNIFACGDITGPYQFTHMASHQAFYCAFNALLRPLKLKVDYRVVPWVTYSDPEIAQVGLNEQSAKLQGIQYDVFKYGVDDLDRAITESEAKGYVKVLTKPGTDKIIGANIVSYNAGEILTEFTSAMKNKLGLNSILGTIHPYPTMSEANKYAAGIWKKSTVTPFKLKLAEFIMKLKR